MRQADHADATALAALLSELGYPVTAGDVSERLDILTAGGEPPMLAEDAGQALGCVTWHVTPVLHRPGPVGRLTLLIVSAPFRGSGIGTALVQAVEARVTALGCVLLEVTSNAARADAHAFYERLGFERTSYRFGKQIGPQQQGG